MSVWGELQSSNMEHCTATLRLPVPTISISESVRASEARWASHAVHVIPK